MQREQGDATEWCQYSPTHEFQPVSSILWHPATNSPFSTRTKYSAGPTGAGVVGTGMAWSCTRRRRRRQAARKWVQSGAVVKVLQAASCCLVI